MSTRPTSLLDGILCKQEQWMVHNFSLPYLLGLFALFLQLANHCLWHNGDYNFACSDRVRTLLGGPPRLPPLPSLAMGLSVGLNPHRARWIPGARSSKISETYRPMTGRNLKQLEPLSLFASSMVLWLGLVILTGHYPQWLKTSQQC